MLNSSSVATRNYLRALSPAALKDELLRIADWWLDQTQDEHYGGFIGEVDSASKPVANAAKGSVLNSRLLWFFSTIAQLEPQPQFRNAADRAYGAFIENFCDKEFGGTYWELTHDNSVLDDNKQVYAQCFYIYALAAYFKLTQDQQAIASALRIFDLLEEHALDRLEGGYIESLDRQWQRKSTQRLSDEDLVAPKSMNTHLHVVEAYSALYEVTGAQKVAAALRSSIQLFDDYILDHDTGHLRMFFNGNWADRSTHLSFGHDIEASWLLWKAVSVLGDESMIQRFRAISLTMVDQHMESALGDNGESLDQASLANGQNCEASVWWVQAEALVGYLAAFKQTRDPRYLKVADGIWRFIQDNHIDQVNGEWHWLGADSAASQQPKYKAGFWKGPYHNGRAMMVGHQLLTECEGDL